MDKIKELIRQKREKLSVSSLNTYSSILKNLFIKIFGDIEFDENKFNETEKVLKFLKDTPVNKRKTILSALVIITNKKEYRDLMLDDVKDYNNEISKQEKTPEQVAAWIETDDINKTYEELKNNALLLYKKKHLKPSDLQQIQDFIIISLLGGIFIPPRRSKDYVDFVIKNPDKEKDNYIDKNKLYFNSYKTAKTYGQQNIEVPKPLLLILKKWISINPTNYLLFDSNLNKLSSIKLNQRLNKIFNNKKVGINSLRHSYLTNKYKATIDLNKDINNTMKEMGSSSQQLETYVKK